jgi:hypothetical protein
MFAKHRPTEVMLAVPDLIEHFKTVPEGYFKREGPTAVIECPCGWTELEDPDLREQRIDFGELHECPGCLRLYFLGRRLHAASPNGAPAIEHAHPYNEACLPGCPEYQ